MITKSVVFQLFKNLYENRCGEISDNSVDENTSYAAEENIANQLFELFLQLCDCTTEVTEHEILEYLDDFEDDFEN